jgi:hypothetical protein
MLVKPAAGLKVRDPATLTLVPDEGIEVSEHDLYWVRALRDGDVVDATPAPPAKAKAGATPDTDKGSAG